MTHPSSSVVSNADLITPHAKRTFALLPGLLMAAVVAASAYWLRDLPGLNAFSPLILAILIGTAFHNLIGTPAIAKPGVAFSMRRLLRFGIVLLGANQGSVGYEIGVTLAHGRAHIQVSIDDEHRYQDLIVKPGPPSRQFGK